VEAVLQEHQVSILNVRVCRSRTFCDFSSIVCALLTYVIWRYVVHLHLTLALADGSRVMHLIYHSQTATSML
jgi:hypothetical protein